MKAGDKVICVEDEYGDALTYNKEYTIIDVEEGYRVIKIIDDEGDEIYYDADFFKLVEQKNDRMKAGDKVRCIIKDTVGYTFGETYKIQKVNEKTIVVFDDENELDIVDKKYFELVDEFEPTKSYLMKHKDEYLCETRVGCRFCIKETHNLIGSNEDLTDNNGIKDFDITKIYKLTQVWEREERRELTIEEAENEFNIKIKGE